MRLVCFESLLIEAMNCEAVMGGFRIVFFFAGSIVGWAGWSLDIQISWFAYDSHLANADVREKVRRSRKGPSARISLMIESILPEPRLALPRSLTRSIITPARI
jgi:hypothetical protein